jgi:MoaA/NifB/PqqE/SkfB family radical SAM enzyme
LGNVTPVISIEGGPAESDRRRGGSGVYGQAVEALDRARRAGLVFGVACSLCKTNIEEMLRETLLRDLIDRGAMYAWYYIYRPVGPRPHPELALDADQIRRVREFLVEMRTRMPIVLVDSYWDQDGRALCPAAVGVSHHVGPWGHVEPCPPIQLADVRLAEVDIEEALDESAFLASFRRTASKTTRGCILLESPRTLEDLAESCGATDSSARGTYLQELRELPACASHHQPGREIPERHWAYRLAKKHWFFGFGAYG